MGNSDRRTHHMHRPQCHPASPWHPSQPPQLSLAHRWMGMRRCSSPALLFQLVLMSVSTVSATIDRRLPLEVKERAVSAGANKGRRVSGQGGSG